MIPSPFDTPDQFIREARAPKAPAAEPRRPRRTIHEQARDIPVRAETDILVVGGGPAGCAAAVAAARLGAAVTLVERYGHLGGLSTGGLVIWIDRMTDWNGRQVVAGVGGELIERLPDEARLEPARDLWGSKDPALVSYWADRANAFRGTVTWSPLIDPEWLKNVSLQLVVEAGVKLLLHTWGVAPIVGEDGLRGVIFESKEGRQAVLAKVVIDTTGDGDLFALAGASFEADVEENDLHHCMNVAWCWAGVDMARWFAFKHEQPEAYSEFFRRGAEQLGFLERAHPAWRNDVALFMGPRLSGYSPVSIEDLTTVEIESRRLMEQHLAFYRAHAPGFKDAWIMLSAPQVGVRHSRRLAGVKRIDFDRCKQGIVEDDEIGVCPSPSPTFPDISISYGSLVPQAVENLLAAGRHISCDPQTHAFLREIPECWVTGQAAGVGAALAVSQGVRVRDVDLSELQEALRTQNVFLNVGRPVAVG